ncbi:hypothetical protein RSJ42_09230 [Methanosarcina hadiensis]|uniref:hypothetical protein n=1 Tax=Methanosarcina hadiensis TaxID=3078083 RepID=UPI003977977E
MSKIRTVFLSFIASEIFILTIELIFEIPFNVYYYMDPSLTKQAVISFPFLFSNDGQTNLSGISIFVKSLFGLFLWLLTSPALLIAVVVYILAPEDEGKPAAIHTSRH